MIIYDRLHFYFKKYKQQFVFENILDRIFKYIDTMPKVYPINMFHEYHKDTSLSENPTVLHSIDPNCSVSILETWVCSKIKTQNSMRHKHKTKLYRGIMGSHIETTFFTN